MTILEKLRIGRWWVALVLAAAVSAVILFAPGPIDGCYTFRDVVTSAHNFLYFSDGNVIFVREYSTNRHFGTYAYEKSRGWIWSDTGTGRQILVRPGILWIRFDPADGIDRLPKLPFEWRDFNVFKTAEILKRKGAASAGNALTTGGTNRSNGGSSSDN